MKDRMIRIVTADGTLRAVAASTTTLVEELRRLQGTDPTATVALGRTATAAALLGALLKGSQRLALTLEGNGPLQRLQAETDAFGAVRASVKQPIAGLPPREGAFDVAGALGKAGFLHVVKDLGLKEPYRGMVQLYRSTIGEDLAYYLTTSEQTPSSVALGVYLAEDGSVAAAGGLLVQTLPPQNEEAIALLEERLGSMAPVAAQLHDGLEPADILEKLFAGLDYRTVQETELRFRCRCDRAQVGALLRTLGKEELQGLIEEQQGATVTCEFCRRSYSFSAAELAGFAASSD